MSEIPLTWRFSELKTGTQRDWELEGKADSPWTATKCAHLPPEGVPITLPFRPRAISHQLSESPRPVGTAGSLRLQSCLSQVLVFLDASPPALGLDPDYSFANWPGATVAPPPFHPFFLWQQMGQYSKNSMLLQLGELFSYKKYI